MHYVICQILLIFVKDSDTKVQLLAATLADLN